jgi:sulfotransferase family protein
VTDSREGTQTAERPSVPAPDNSAEPGLAHDLERALRPRRENVVPVDQPLALICQAQRSGGTLLARLFDGHPQCHAHPHELLIGHPKPHTWPELGLDEPPETWFAKLRESYLSTLFRKGRRTIPMKAPGEKSKGAYPFLLPPTFQRLIFLQEVERRSPITSERQILDAYMTSLFNAWLDNQNLRGAEKRWVVAFSPRRAWGEGREKLFELYPDGRLVSILRDPLSWFTSAQGRDPEADPEPLFELWVRSAQEMIEAKDRYPDLIFILRFDDLVRQTDKTMRSLARFLGIDYDPVLTTPTFNGYPVGANSSYEVRTTGVLTDPLERHKELLSDEQRKRILAECDQLHKQALKVADTRPASTRSRSASRKKPAQKRKTTKGSSTRSSTKSNTRTRSTSSKR